MYDFLPYHQNLLSFCKEKIDMHAVDIKRSDHRIDSLYSKAYSIDSRVEELEKSLKSLDCSLSTEKEKIAKGEERILKICGNLAVEVKETKESITNEFMDEMNQLKGKILKTVFDEIKKNLHCCKNCEKIFSNLVEKETRVFENHNIVDVFEEKHSSSP